MSKTIVSTSLISLILALISFSTSLQTNILADATLRSIIVLLLTFLLLNAFISGVRAIVGSNSSSAESDQQTQPLQHNPVQSDSSEAEAKQDEESYKGGHINLQTPDDDHFQPLKPEELYKQEN
jgi:hypothetical protein